MLDTSLWTWTNSIGPSKNKSLQLKNDTKAPWMPDGPHLLTYRLVIWSLSSWTTSGPHSLQRSWQKSFWDLLRLSPNPADSPTPYASLNISAAYTLSSTSLNWSLKNQTSWMLATELKHMQAFTLGTLPSPDPSTPYEISHSLGLRVFSHYDPKNKYVHFL